LLGLNGLNGLNGQNGLNEKTAFNFEGGFSLALRT
jgi:hypothetical protein